MNADIQIRSIVGFCIGTILFSAACGRSSISDVSDVANLSGYEIGLSYVLQSDMFLLKTEEKLATPLAVAPDGDIGTWRMYTAPKDMESWRNSKSDEYEKEEGSAYLIATTPIGILSEGTVLEVSAFELESSWSWFYGSGGIVFPIATIMSGDFAGSRVNLFDVSLGKSAVEYNDLTLAALGPNPKFIRERE